MKPLAPPNATVITLLTSLVADLIDKGLTPDAAETLVQNSLNLPSFVDLTSLDPIAATNNNQPGGIEVLAAMIMVQNFITQTMKLIDGASTAANNAIVKSIVGTLTNQIKSGVTLDMSNPTQLETIINQAAVSVQLVDPNLNLGIISNIAKDAAVVMAESNQRIDKIVSNTPIRSVNREIARLQKVALGEISLNLKAAASGFKPINGVVAKNTGAAKDALLQATIALDVPGVPIITRLPKFGSTHLFDSDFYL